MNMQKQIVAFIVIGGVNTLFGYFVYAFLIFMGLYYPLAMFLSTCAGILFNFKTTGKVVFGYSNYNALSKFISVYAVVYIFNIAMIQLIQLFMDNLYWAGFVALIPAAVLSFVLNKFVVFRSLYAVR